MIVSGALDISKPIPPPLKTVCDLLGRRKANKGDESLGSRESWEDRCRRVYPNRSYGLREQGDFILGFLTTLRIRVKPTLG